MPVHEYPVMFLHGERVKSRSACKKKKIAITTELIIAKIMNAIDPYLIENISDRVILHIQSSIEKIINENTDMEGDYNNGSEDCRPLRTYTKVH